MLRRLAIEMQVSPSGELLARGNHILKSYWDNPEATDEALEGGWFHTGDGGFEDDAGYYSITDRKKDVIISGGEKRLVDRSGGCAVLPS